MHATCPPSYPHSVHRSYPYACYMSVILSPFNLSHTSPCMLHVLHLIPLQFTAHIPMNSTCPPPYSSSISSPNDIRWSVRTVKFLHPPLISSLNIKLSPPLPVLKYFHSMLSVKVKYLVSRPSLWVCTGMNETCGNEEPVNDLISLEIQIFVICVCKISDPQL